MTGYIQSFVQDKGFGFITGDDGKKYFVHISDIPLEVKTKLTDGMYFAFDTKPTEKGYSAIRCKLVPEHKVAYSTPDACLLSKHDNIHGYEILESTKWTITGSSRQSPDAAEKDLIRGAEIVGANAILKKEYFKTTGSEPGTGNGTYYYTIHNFIGVAATVAKKDPKGPYTKDELSIGLSDRCANISEAFSKEYGNDQRNAWIFAGVIIFFLLIINHAVIHNTAQRTIDIIDYIVFGICIIVGYKIIQYPSDKGWWLVRK